MMIFLHSSSFKTSKDPPLFSKDRSQKDQKKINQRRKAMISNPQEKNAFEKFRKKHAFLQNYFNQTYPFSFDFKKTRTKQVDSGQAVLLHSNVSFIQQKNPHATKLDPIGNGFSKKLDLEIHVQKEKILSNLEKESQTQNPQNSSTVWVGSFFPHKKAFMHSWILPFVGFAGYIYLTKFPGSSFEKSNPPLCDPKSGPIFVSASFSTSKETDLTNLSTQTDFKGSKIHDLNPFLTSFQQSSFQKQQILRRLNHDLSMNLYKLEKTEWQNTWKPFEISNKKKMPSSFVKGHAFDTNFPSKCSFLNPTSSFSNVLGNAFPNKDAQIQNPILSYKHASLFVRDAFVFGNAFPNASSPQIFEWTKDKNPNSPKVFMNQMKCLMNFYQQSEKHEISSKEKNKNQVPRKCISKLLQPNFALKKKFSENFQTLFCMKYLSNRLSKTQFHGFLKDATPQPLVFKSENPEKNRLKLFGNTFPKGPSHFIKRNPFHFYDTYFSMLKKQGNVESVNLLTPILRQIRFSFQDLSDETLEKLEEKELSLKTLQEKKAFLKWRLFELITLRRWIREKSNKPLSNFRLKDSKHAKIQWTSDLSSKQNVLDQRFSNMFSVFDWTPEWNSNICSKSKNPPFHFIKRDPFHNYVMSYPLPFFYGPKSDASTFNSFKQKPSFSGLLNSQAFFSGVSVMPTSMLNQPISNRLSTYKSSVVHPLFWPINQITRFKNQIQKDFEFLNQIYLKGLGSLIQTEDLKIPRLSFLSLDQIAFLKDQELPTLFSESRELKYPNSKIYKKYYLLRAKHLQKNHTIFFENQELHVHEKIFRTYLSCKSPILKNSPSSKVMKSSQKTLLKRFKNELKKQQTKIRLNENIQSPFFQPIQKPTTMGESNKKPLKFPPFHFIKRDPFHRRISSTTILRRLGFLFEYDSEISSKDTSKRIEKHRAQQKKRRRKKQKRFYPRPIWLRFLLYKHFLTNRHFSKSLPFNSDSIQSQSCQKGSLKMSLRKNTFQIFRPEFRNVFPFFMDSMKRGNPSGNSTFLKPSKKWKPHAKKPLKSNLFLFRIYQNASKNRSTKIQGSVMNFHSLNQLKTMNHHHYFQISNQVMSDFQRLCWRSSWLRSSLNPYIERIQKSMKTMKEASSKFSDKNTKDFRDLRLHPFKKDSLFEIIQNKAEYDRIVYDRISDLIQNVKASSGSNRNVKSFNLGHSKKENRSLRRPYSMHSNKTNSLASNSSSEKGHAEKFWYDFGFFLNNSLNCPTVRAFSFQSFMDASVKPFGEIPTLRTLWALNRTNVLTLENSQAKLFNETQTLWGSFKRRQQKTSNPTKTFFYKAWKKLVLRPFQSSFVKIGENQTLDFFHKHSNILNLLSLKKLETADKKLNDLGILQKTNKGKLRSLKITLKDFKHSVLEDSKKSHVYQILQSRVESQKQVKRSIHFWWSFQSSANFGEFSWLGNVKEGFHQHLFSENPTFQQVLASFAGCTLLFHICSLFSLMQIPEIRSLGKFYVLILYKLSNSSLIVTYAIFNQIQTYLKQMRSIFFFLKKTHQNQILMRIPNEKHGNFVFYYGMDFKNPYGMDFKNPTPSLISKQNRFMTSGTRIQYLKSIRDFSFFFEKNQKDPKNRLSLTQTPLKTVKKEKEMFTTVFYQRPSTPSLMIPQETWLSPNQTRFLEMCFYLPNFISASSQSEGKRMRSLSSSNRRHSWKNLKKSFQIQPSLIFSWPKNQTHFVHSLLSKNIFEAKNLALKKPNTFVNNSSRQIFDLKKIQTLSSFIWITFLSITKASVSFVYGGIGVVDLCVFKILDLLESGMMLIYKFLEKPAEFLIDWISQFFLVEWASDLPSFVPESFETSSGLWFKKVSRGSRFFFLFGFLIQRRIWELFEMFLNLLTKPDSDLMHRQKKGIIFWDVWAEILMIAAENYGIQLSSLTTVKEEQDSFLERLLNDPNWLRSNLSKMSNTDSEKQTAAFVSQLAEIERLASLGERPESWWGRSSFFYENASVKTMKEFLEKNWRFQIFDLNQKRKVNPLFQKNLKDLNDAFYLSFNQPSFPKVLPRDFGTHEKNMNLKVFDNRDFQQNWKVWQRWATNQHFTRQGMDTDLFMEIHPPKSFAQLSTLKSSSFKDFQNKIGDSKTLGDSSQSNFGSGNRGVSGFQALGVLTCQIYSGLFSKQVSKNILIVGSSGNSKSAFVHALAGETELKIIADHAYRYSHIQRGIAVGMKRLREVFEGLALHTPCLFLMEEIHRIGERRPMLISDNENAKASETSFAAENEEVHEKNQFIYQLSKHAISDYRKPYKGDFSLLIPTNHFCFDLFLGVSPPKVRRLGTSPRSPFALETKFFTTSGSFGENSTNGNDLMKKKQTNYALKSLLQMPSEQFFAPPATSPFTILGMKEQREFKATQIVKQMPWGGFSSDQMMLLPKGSYSVRVKIALLADLAMNQLSVKLDMITDLLVIMDNVRSNRGFVVFATTHVPFVLDPALRRPGRFDETISFPTFPTLMDRFEILKSSNQFFRKEGKKEPIGFMNYGFLFKNMSETDLSNVLSKAKLLLFHQKTSKNSIDFSICETKTFGLFHKKSQTCSRKSFLDKTPIYSLNQAISRMTTFEQVNPQKIQSRNFVSQKEIFESSCETKTLLSHFKKISRPFLSSNLAFAYAKIGKFFIQSQILKESPSFRALFPSFEDSIQQGEETLFQYLYSPTLEIQHTLMYLLSGKVGEVFLLNQLNHQNQYISFLIPSKPGKKESNTNFLRPLLSNSVSQSGFWNLSSSPSFFTKKNGSENAENSVVSLKAIQANRNLGALTEEFWSSATSFVFSLLQKRFLYQKTLLTNRFLYFHDLSAFREPPSPPGSSIQMPGKKYENLKRTERDFQQKSESSILEKIQLHQQQRFMKHLYDRPVVEMFRSEVVQGRYTSFKSSIKELAYDQQFMRKPSSVNAYYKNRLLTRQRFSFVNQWWNGQFAEHNLETTFKSDVDWRSMFVQSFGDLVIDFPDADQHYNPKLRRWFLQSTHGGYWQSFEKTMAFEIYQHFLLLCFHKALNHLENEREMLDFFAYKYLRKGKLHEIELIANLARFHGLKNSFE